MKIFILLFGLITVFSAGHAKFNYFSDISGNEYEKLQETANYLRKKIKDMENSEGAFDKKIPNDFFLNTMKPDYEFLLSKTLSERDDSSSFGFGPSDPRFYENFDNPKKDYITDNHPIFEILSKEKGKEIMPYDDKPSEFENRIMTSNEVQQVLATEPYEKVNQPDIYFIGIIAGCSAAAIFIAVLLVISCYRFRKNAKAAADVDYPAYGITGPNKAVSPIWSDQKLAQSVQMYHYQHQKQQILAMESMNNKERRCSLSDAESEENEEGDYTVYECPGLAPTGEMEVKNPLFQDDQTANQIKQEMESVEEFQYPHNQKQKNLS